jgi:hypothetical protein
MQRHRHQEFIRFLNAVGKTGPASKAMHVILDNYAAHKHPKVIAGLARDPRVTFHFTPNSASWQSEDGCEVEEADVGRRSSDCPQRTEVDSAVD